MFVSKAARVGFLVLVVALGGSALGQAAPPPPTPVGTVFNQVQQVANTWINPILTAATRLFYLLALIDFSWSAAHFLREHDFSGLFLSLVHKLLAVAFFAMVVVNGNVWIPAIVNSFVTLGSNLSGLPTTLTPSDILSSGLQQMNNLAAQFQTTSVLTNFGAAILTAMVIIIILISYLIITLQYIVTKLEAIIVMSAGYLFLGFAGSRWTMPYFERFIALAISSGTRLLLIYLMLAAFMGPNGLDQTWQQQIAAYKGGQPLSDLFPTLGAMLLFAFATWMVPKMAGSIASGSLGLGAAELLSAGTTAAGATVAGMGAAASLATGGASLAVGAFGALSGLRGRFGGGGSGSGDSSSSFSGGGGGFGKSDGSSGGGTGLLEGGGGVPALVPPPSRAFLLSPGRDNDLGSPPSPPPAMPVRPPRGPASSGGAGAIGQLIASANTVSGGSGAEGPRSEAGVEDARPGNSRQPGGVFAQKTGGTQKALEGEVLGPVGVKAEKLGERPNSGAGNPSPGTQRPVHVFVAQIVPPVSSPTADTEKAVPRHKALQEKVRKTGAAISVPMYQVARRLHDLDFHDGAGHAAPPQMRIDTQ